jgi:hypothetical protein
MQGRRVSSVLFFQRRWQWLRWGAPAAVVIGGLFGWWVVAWQADAKSDAVAAVAPARSGAASAPPRTTTPPFSVTGQQTREAQLALWQRRLERAEQAQDHYAVHTRFPHTSRPADEQADQMYPNEPVVEEHPLREPKGQAAAGVRLRTTQERVFVQGDESVRFSVALVDEEGRAQPLRVLAASAREVTPASVASLYPPLPVTFGDDGTNGDRTAGDRELTATLRPAVQGFAKLAGQIRVEVSLEGRGERGFTYFDIYVTPDAPATWSGRVRDAIDSNGALNFYLGATVREPGRYVVTGRIDDADGQAVALLTFNDEVGRGDTEFTLSLFGKLVREAQPAMPLTLRDVVAFRLREEGHPDRALMPRLNGTVHVSAKHALTSLSNAEWSGEERSRYLAELTRDVEEAQKKVEQLSAAPAQKP